MAQIRRKFTTVAMVYDGEPHPEDIIIWIEYTDTTGNVISIMKDKSCCLLSGRDPKVVEILPSSLDWKKFFSVTSKDGIITVSALHGLFPSGKRQRLPPVIGEREVNFPD